ncbi:hypothetical protein IVB38_28440 [Bradyrhizobium sp. 38]|uniref:hypothetical protein n=1 Tax=unclassified Bradyrhizobium TaxID=2631580 RepID=UPI001FF74C89|nr:MULTISPECIES: hypothetical protein [unclassified Bradyrhizobium]MCK1339823.1 hypothetical protein [Bradyrhizobium sp. 38]MCK1782754.1 hypothetical protein [Bradyrhizobium sp. 132]
MRARYFACLLPICELSFACGPTASRSSADAVTFDRAERLADFDFAAWGKGGPPKWSIIDNDAGRGLARTGPEPSDKRLAFAFYRPFTVRDVYVSTRFLTDGKNGQAADWSFGSDRPKNTTPYALTQSRTASPCTALPADGER